MIGRDTIDSFDATWYQGSAWDSEADLIPEDSEPYIAPDDDCWAESAEEWAAGLFDE